MYLFHIPQFDFHLNKKSAIITLLSNRRESNKQGVIDDFILSEEFGVTFDLLN